VTISALLGGLQALRQFSTDGDVVCQSEWIRVRVRAPIPDEVAVNLCELGWCAVWNDAYCDEHWEWVLD